MPEEYFNSLDYKIRKLFPVGGAGVINKVIAEKIQNILSKIPESKGIKINWDKLNESHEAWLHVLINDTKDSDYQGFNNIKAVLTWGNSD